MESRVDSQLVERDALDASLRKVVASPPHAESPVIPELDSLDGGRARNDLLRAVHLKVRVELGRVRLPLRDILGLGPGSIVDLEKLADDPVEIYVDELLVARGEVLVVNDSFCVRVTEVFSQGAAAEVVS